MISLKIYPTTVVFTMEDLRYQWKGGESPDVQAAGVGSPEFRQVFLFKLGKDI